MPEVEAAENEGAQNEGAENLFVGGGEMGARMRATDWTQTPLGAPSGWQQSLKAAVQIILNSRYPMFIWWGEHRINLYNDDYAPILGPRHPRALGKPAEEIWGDIWDVVGPQSEAVMKKGQATWNEELLLLMQRYGFIEETYFSFSYSPIPSDAGGIGGLFCACTEETAKVVSRRRLKTLRDLGERTAETQTADEACAAAAETLAQNQHDLPFALIYLLDRESRGAVLCETARIERGTAASPLAVELGGASDVWNFARVIETGKNFVFDDLEAKAGAMPPGAFGEAPRRAIVLPLAKAVSSEGLSGFLVAGLSPNIVFNDDYRSFLELVAGHIATAIANARALEEERRRAEKLAELDRAKTEFFSNVSHEFRTPLTLMLGNLEEVLRRDAEIPEAPRAQIETAHRNSLRLLKLVNNLLDFSRIEAGRTRVNFEPTDICRLTEDLASVFRSAIERAGIRYTVESRRAEDASEASATLVDREMWEKIVFNLISNAFKFTFDGEIAVALIEREETVELKVRDSGVGIPADELAHVFERFHRVQATRGRTHEGTGIGLSLVQELVRLHGGEIRAESELGRGTVFTVSIPKRKADQTMPAASKPANISARASDVLQSYLFEPQNGNLSLAQDERQDSPLLPFYAPSRVLLADDNIDMRGYISRLLTHNGYTVETVADGQEALDYLETTETLPDLVITDVMMPHLDGFALVEKLRARERTKTVPILMLSARAGEESKVEGLDAGADDYLIKPFSARELLARVGSIIELAKMRRAVEAEREKSFTILEGITDAFFGLDRELRFTYVNRRAAEFLKTTPEELVGRDLREAFPAVRGTRYLEEYEKALREHAPSEFEIFSPISHRWLEVHIYPTDDGLLVFFRDIMNRKRAESRMLLLAEISDLMRRIDDVDELLYAVSAAVGEHFGAQRCLFNEIDLENDIEIVHRDYCRDAESVAGRHRISDYSPVTSAEMKAGRTVVNRDSQTDPRTAEFYEKTYASSGERAYLAVPLCRENRWVASLWLSDDKPRFWNREEITLVETIADRIWSVVEKLRIDAALRESETHFQRTTEAAHVGTWQYDFATKKIIWNDVQQKMLGYEPSNQPADYVKGTQRVVAEDLRLVEESIKKCLLGAENYDVEYRVVPFGGTEVRWIRTTGKAIFNEAGQAVSIHGVSLDITDRKEAAARIEAQSRRLQALAGIALRLAKTRDLNEQIKIITDEARAIVGAHQAVTSLTMTDDWTQAINAISLSDKYAAYRNFEPPPNGSGVYHLVCQTNEPLRLTQDELMRHPSWRGFGEYAEAHPPMRGWLAAPLVGSDGRNIGLVQLSDKHEGEFDAEDEAILVQLAQQASAVIEKSRAENALRESEQRFRLMADAVPQIIWVTDRDGNNEFFNKQWVDFSGTPFEPLTIPQVAAEFLHPEDAPKVVAAFEKARETGEGFEVEQRNRSKTGEYRWFLNRAEPYRDPLTGEIIKYFGVGVDIHDRKLAEAALAESEERFRNMADNAPVMVWVTNETGNCTYLSESWYAFTGQTPDVALGFGWLDATHPDDRQRAEEIFLAATQNATDFRVEYRLRDKNGDYRWAIDAAKPRFGVNGEFLGYVGSVTDIHERKQIEEQIKYQLSLTQTIMDNTQSCLIMMDALGRCTFANHATERVTGFTPGELMGKVIHEVIHNSHQDGSNFSMNQCPLANAFALRKPVVGFEDFFIHKQGHFYPVRCAARPIFKSGETIGTVLEVQDVTEEKRIAEERERLLLSERIAREEAENANRLKDEFLATVSHELRTPLNAILGWATMARKTDEPEVLNRAMEVIERSARNQSQIISDILDVSRIITGKLHLNLKSVRLSRVVQAASDTVRPSLDAKRIQLKTDLDVEHEIEMAGDADRLQQIVWNLLSNAVKFTPEDGEIAVRLSYRSGFAEVAVTDTGEGITPEFLPFVFDRFRQADGKWNRKHGGLGLGLAVVRHLTELHGGSATVESGGPGRGAAFTVRLPLREYTADAAGTIHLKSESEIADTKAAAPRRILEDIRVLAVDDQADALELVRYILREHGAEVLTAESVDAALVILDGEKIDAIVSDIGMPGRDGYELIGELLERFSRENRKIPTVALTAYASEKDNERVLLAGFQAFLPKPVEPAELVAKIAELTYRENKELLEN